MQTNTPNKAKQNLAIRLLRVLRYNKARTERCISLLPDKHKPLFHALPFLLHVNHKDLPGYVNAKQAPHGLHNYTLRPDIADALKDVFFNEEDITDRVKKMWPKRRCIESVLLMGSVGTIAQEEDSDFDYWVCIDSKKLYGDEIDLLQQKVTAIEQWAMSQYGLEVHFFISDINKVKQNDFGIADGESAGSAQAIILKAEFYSTNIVVAGKAPFWWLTPDNADNKEYATLYSKLHKHKSLNPNWVMDLGNLERMDPNELFGAAIWQLSKAVDSPFKSVLKMAKLEVFLENLQRQQPLCNQLKKRVHQTNESSPRLEPVDPYSLMFDQLIEHYTRNGRDKVVALLQQCLYIKCQSQLSEPVDMRTANFKHRIMSNYVNKWGWDDQQVKQLDHIDSWTFEQQIALSKRIHSFLIQCYRRMSSKFNQHLQLVSQEDMTVLGRRLSTFYAKKAHKVEFLRSSFGDELYCPLATIKSRRNIKGERQWTLYAGDHTTTPREEAKDDLIRSDSSTVQLVSWCVINKIIDRKTKILLDYDSEPVTESDLQHLTKHVSLLFPPLKVNAIPRQQLLKPRKIETCLVVLNFESSRLRADVDEIAVIYSTSWGERFVLFGKESFDGFCEEISKQKTLPERCMLTPDYSHKKRLVEDFLNASSITFDLR